MDANAGFWLVRVYGEDIWGWSEEFMAQWLEFQGTRDESEGDDVSLWVVCVCDIVMDMCCKMQMIFGFEQVYMVGETEMISVASVICNISLHEIAPLVFGSGIETFELALSERNRIISVMEEEVFAETFCREEDDYIVTTTETTTLHQPKKQNKGGDGSKQKVNQSLSDYNQVRS
jgi:hypothetical protein